MTNLCQALIKSDDKQRFFLEFSLVVYLMSYEQLGLTTANDQ